MSLPASKRRRVDDASRTLSAPFKSPLKSNSSFPLTRDASVKTPRRSSTPYSTSPGNAPSNHDPSGLLSSDTHDSPVRPSPKSSGYRASTGVGTQTLGSRSTNRVATPSDPELSALVARERQLQRDISTIRSENDTLRQAGRIEAKGLDRELEKLIQKWRHASREAAEELFGQAKEKVNGMGGPKAWHDAQRRQTQFRNGGDGGFGGSWGFGVDKPSLAYADATGEGDDEDQGKDTAAKESERYAAEYGVDPPCAAEIEATSRNGGGASGESEDDDTFTMTTLLRSLNVELDVIGWNAAAGRWSD
ncbi:MAG: hypothetical protein M1837_006951 [Sclerophora amabilis]|nr:MAG: hypothetical protein M1837_006951 [Sclerophora amabilis]